MPQSPSSTRKSGAGSSQKNAARKSPTTTKLEKKPVEITPPAPPTTAAPGATTPGNRPRRTIFLDVENTSSEEALYGALEHLQIDRSSADVDLVAVGNWRVIGAHVARMLAQRGARLLHSAPATGVKDWSDLAIAVQAGICLGRARPGDSIAIVSADRAFDAVADAAATLGVEFRRLTYGVSSGLAERIEPAKASSGSGGRRRRRGGRGRRGSSVVALWPAEPAVAEKAEPRKAHAARAPHAAHANTAATDRGASKDAQGATPEHVLGTIARLSARAPERGVNLDLLINALKSEGFGRPPGSPRLVTRLRMMKDVEVSPTGMVRLVNWPAAGEVTQTAGASAGGNGASAVESAAKAPEGAGDPSSAATEEAPGTTPAPRKRSSRRRGSRGGRGRGRKQPASAKKGPEAGTS